MMLAVSFLAIVCLLELSRLLPDLRFGQAIAFVPVISYRLTKNRGKTVVDRRESIWAMPMIREKPTFVAINIKTVDYAVSMQTISLDES